MMRGFFNLKKKGDFTIYQVLTLVLVLAVIVVGFLAYALFFDKSNAFLELFQRIRRFGS